MTHKQIPLKLPKEISELYKRKPVEKTGDELLKKWMKSVVDMGPTNATEEHDVVF